MSREPLRDLAQAIAFLASSAAIGIIAGLLAAAAGVPSTADSIAGCMATEECPVAP